MKKLTLIRHAKSSWEHPVVDFERPLKKRGELDANLVSKYAKLKVFKPDLILSSDANRAKSTAKIFIKNLDFQDVDFQYNNQLYDFSGRDLLTVIKNTNDTINDLIIFGHNHAITAFVNSFGSIYFENVPTSGLVSIQFDIPKWKKIVPGTTVLKIFPKDLK
ncbi:histidine phosphatase family protein [Oceanihabitans sediminis]|uniref:SixA phosphatase family protein n=1 Tax=Oceanihabitans sediminis TaxID=1812012 RepID=UPI0009308C1E|nr:histidine phosphatase family protein [Oceanihabitans sediminis]MDX1279265.1 histidine phosphatase family protein [Oceanihabitans sediminis]MDX1773740.1 histidine phosphatase family protein [Oceanihabitans sediminis]